MLADLILPTAPESFSGKPFKVENYFVEPLSTNTANASIVSKPHKNSVSEKGYATVGGLEESNPQCNEGPVESSAYTPARINQSARKYFQISTTWIDDNMVLFMLLILLAVLIIAGLVLTIQTIVNSRRKRTKKV
jgi:hypothetical protein